MLERRSVSVDNCSVSSKDVALAMRRLATITIVAMLASHSASDIAQEQMHPAGKYDRS